MGHHQIVQVLPSKEMSNEVHYGMEEKIYIQDLLPDENLEDHLLSAEAGK